MSDATMIDGPAKPVSEADLRLGRRLRALRVERNLSLADLATRVGMSIGALSQIERGLSSLRVKVIWPLAAALDIGPADLIGDDAEPGNDLYCVRVGRRRSLPVKSEGIRKDLLSPPGAALTGMLVIVEPGGGTDSYAHTGHEFGLVTVGEVELVVDSAHYVLKAGDSFGFRSTLLHSFQNPGTEPCHIVWVNTQKPAGVQNG